MNCPEEIAQILLEILEQSMLNIRSAAHQGKMEQCFQEADHVHNLPSVLSSFSQEKAKYYWDVERTIYAKRSQGNYAKSFDSQWKKLEKFMV